MVRTQVQLTEEQSLKLKRIAAREQKSVAELVRQAIDQWLVLAEPLSVEERSSALFQSSESITAGFQTWA